MATVRKRTWKSTKGVGTDFFVDFYDAQGNRQRQHFKTRAEANDFRVEIEGQLRVGTYRPETSKVTVWELAEMFLEHCRGRMERGERMTPRNYQVYLGYIRNYICPSREWHAAKHADPSHRFQYFDTGIGHYRLSRVTVGIVTKFRDDLRATGLSVATTRKIIAMLQVMLAYGIASDLLVFNAAAGVEVIGRREDEARRVVPPSKEIMRQLVELADTRFRVKLLFAAATGVRAGELHALRWRHVDFARREVRIEVRVDPYGNEEVPKTKAGMRSIPLGEGVIACLRTWRDISRFSEANDLVFPNQNGGFYNHDGMVKGKFLPLFGKLCARWQNEGRNEQPETFNWHALRHFAISCWIDAGLPPKTIQTFAGHSSLQVTMDRYGHLFKSDEHGRAMDAISSMLFEPKDPTATKGPQKGENFTLG